MKLKQVAIVGLLATIPLFQNCSKAISVSDENHQATNQSMNSLIKTNEVEEIPEVPIYPVTKLDISELHYFRGGWYGPYPNWASDLKFSKNVADTISGTFSIISKHSDPECFRPVAQISEEEQRQLISLIRNLQIKTIDQSQGPFWIDGGTHTLRIRYASGDVKEKLISFSQYLENALINHYATNGEELVKFIENVEARLNVVCQ